MKKAALRYFLLIVLIVNPSVFANETSMKSPVSSPVYTDTVRVDSSRFNRAGKYFSLLVQPVGLNYGSFGGGVGAALFVNPRFQLSLTAISLVTIFNRFTQDKDTGESVKLNDDHQGKVYEFAAKVFLTNSFYVSPYLFRRNMQFRERDGNWIFGGSGEVVGSGEIEDSGMGLKIGNQWQWSKFTLGCNWLSYSESVFSSKQKGDLRLEVNRARFGGSEFYLGMSF